MIVKIIFFLVLITIAIVFLSQLHLFDGVDIQPFLKSLFSPSSLSPKTTPENVIGGSGSAVAPQKVPEGFTRAELSPYFGMVRITSVRLPQTPLPSDYEQVSLSRAGSGKRVDLGEWYLRSNRGFELIPYAVHSLDFVSPEPPAPVSLGSGDVLNIYSSVSPIGANFRTNTCSGYLNTEYPFAPPFPMECPAINRRDIITFTGACQEFILSLPACQSVVRPAWVPLNDVGCQAYVRSINYQGCVNRHRYDANFLGTELRAWTGHRFLDPLHDRVLLFDRNGLLVDEYVY